MISTKIDLKNLDLITKFNLEKVGEHTNSVAKFTLFTGSESVSKGYEIINEKLSKVNASNFYEGHFETITAMPRDILNLIKTMKPGQFITSGVHETLLKGNCPQEATRSIETFKHPAGRGILIIDGDSVSDFGIESCEDFVKKLKSLDPSLKSTHIVVSTSSSSNIQFNKSNSGLRGLHCFSIIDEAKCIPRVLEILHQRAILAGLSRVQITANGTILIKSIIDLAMRTSNQPCFEGGARLLSNLITQNREVIEFGNEILISSEITQLTKQEKSKYEEICVRLKEMYQDEAYQIQTSWREKREANLIKRGTTPEQAKRIIDQAFEGGNLSGEMEIITDKFGKVTVNEILDDPKKFNEMTCADPMDPEYGANKAKIYCLQDKPCINSMAHGGGTQYYLIQAQYTHAELKKIIEDVNEFSELTGRLFTLVRKSNLNKVERESLLKLISKKSKVSLSTLKNEISVSDYSESESEYISHIEVTKDVISLFGRENLLYVNNTIYRWGSGIWAKIDDREVKKAIHRLVKSDDLNTSAINSIVDMIKTEIHHTDHKFDIKPDSINCINGELTLSDGNWILGPHVRDHFHTTMIPVEHDQSAASPRFDQFLREVFNGDLDCNDKIKIVQEAMGYSFVSTCHLEKFFMLIGSGSNGKSVLLRLLTDLLGRKNVCAVQPNKFDNQFQRAHLQSKLANIITEIAEGAEIADDKLKSLVSGELTIAEHKHKAPFEFIPYAKHWFGTNHLPKTKDFSNALFRRAIIVRFNNTFSVENKNLDVNLHEKLLKELQGIFNFALEGLKRLKTQNAFTLCASSEQILSEWELGTDQVKLFIDEVCEIKVGSRLTSRQLYTTYKSWASNSGIATIINHNNFTTRLKLLGYGNCRGSGGVRLISGISLKK